MPFETQSYLDAGVRAPGLIQPPDAPDVVRGGPVWQAAARDENMMFSAYNYMAERSGFTYDPNHNPLDTLKDSDPKYEARYLHRFVDSRSLGDTLSRMQRIDREEADDRLLDAAGFEGFVARTVMGGLDPLLLLPAGIIFRGAKTGRAALQSAGATGLAAAGIAGLQEAVLYGTQETRTGVESTMHIATGTIVGALLGGAVGYLTSKQLAQLTDTMEGFRKEINAEMAAGGRTMSAGVVPPNIVSEIASADPVKVAYNAWFAARGGPQEQLDALFQAYRQALRDAMDARGVAPSALDELITKIGLRASVDERGVAAAGEAAAEREGLTLAGALRAEKALGRLSPVTRQQMSPFNTARAGMRDMADAGLAYKENWEGVPTSGIETGGVGTVETRIKMRRGPLIEYISAQDDAYARYFFDKAEVSGFERRSLALQAGWARVTGQMGGKFTYREFREEIGKATRRGDEHPIPQIEEMAKLARDKVFDPPKDVAIKQGQLPEDVKTLGAQSYLTRVYNRVRIRAERDQFHGILLRHFTKLRDEAAQKFETKKAKTVATLELEHADLTTPTAARPALMQRLEADLERHLADNPTFTALDQHLKDLRARTSKAATTEEKAALRAEEKATRADAGPEYVQFVNTRNQLAKRMDRLNRTEPVGDAAAVAPGTRPEQIAALKAAHKSELGELEKRLDEVMDTHAHARDKELEQAKSIAKQQSEGASRRAKTVITGRLREAEARIALAHADIVAKESKPFVRLIRDLKKQQARELKAGTAKLTKAEQSANRAADLSERIGQERAKPGNDLVRTADADMPGLVDDIINTLLGESVYRIPGLSLIMGPKGPLRKRILNIPDEAIEEYLESDIEKVARIYTQSMWSDIEVAAKFGDVKMTDLFARLKDEFNTMVGRVPQGPAHNKTRTALAKKYEESVRDLGAVRDRLRGNYRPPDDPEGLAYRAGKVMLNLNYVAKGGGFTISSLADPARPIFRYGMNGFRDSWVPFIKEMAMTGGQGARVAARQVRLAGTATEFFRDQRAMDLADVFEEFGQHTAPERGLQWLADRMSTLNLMGRWNGFNKTFTGWVASAEVLRASEAWAKGTATGKQISGLARNGIDEGMARKIAAYSTATSSKTKGGIILPNTEDWRLPGGEIDTPVVEAFLANVNRDVETLIVTRGVEPPLLTWIDPMLARILLQFKSFNIVSTQRTTLAGLQDRDAAILSGVLLSMGLGAMSAWAKAQLRGEDTSKWTQGKWVIEGLDNSGILGVLGEANAMTEKATRGRVGLSVISGKEVSRYQSRNMMGTMLGPSMDFAQDALTIAQLAGPAIDAVTGRETPPGQRWTGSHTHAVFKVAPLRTLFYLRGIFDKVEAGINNSLNIPQRRPRH